MKKHIPNLLTLMNLASGVMALYLVLNNAPEQALYFMLAAIIFDFADGLAARLLKAASDIGKQLDSLADLVSFGLVPAAMIFMIIHHILMNDPGTLPGNEPVWHQVLQYTILLVPALAALRLARFNLQPPSDFFIGLPVPAFALFWTGIYYDYSFKHSFFGQSLNEWFVWGVMILMSLMMIVPLPMISLKFRNLSLKSNLSRYFLLSIAVLILSFTGIPGLPLAILTYILVSLVRILLT